MAVTTPGAAGVFLTIARAPRLALTDHDDPAEAIVIVTAGTDAARRPVVAALLRVGTVGDASVVVAVADRLAVPFPPRPFADKAAASTTAAWSGCGVGDVRTREAEVFCAEVLAPAPAGGAAAGARLTTDSSDGENPSSSLTPPTLIRTITKSAPSLTGSPTRTTVPVVATGNCEPVTRTRGRRPSAIACRRRASCASSSPVSLCDAI